MNDEELRGEVRTTFYGLSGIFWFWLFLVYLVLLCCGSIPFLVGVDLMLSVIVLVGIHAVVIPVFFVCRSVFRVMKHKTGIR
jgi:hypothetical protein